jgi:hypothetical protein
VVPVRPRRVADYEEAAGEEAIGLREAAEPLRGARLLQVNSMAFGGGVAALLHMHVPLLNDLGIETVWTPLEGADAFASPGCATGRVRRAEPWCASASCRSESSRTTCA